MKKFLPLLLLPALVACGGEETHADRKAKLLTYRSLDEICTTTSEECKTWTAQAVVCEENLANAVPGNACTLMENYRETVTGIELSTAPGAYNF